MLININYDSNQPKNSEARREQNSRKVKKKVKK